MAKYHISLNGEAVPCGARTKPCPRAEHFDSFEKAQHVAELAHEAFEKSLEYPRSENDAFLKNQASIFWYMDQGFGSMASPYLEAGLSQKASDAKRKEDYSEGFKVGMWAIDNSMQDAAVTGYRRSRLEAPIDSNLPVDAVAFKLGFARAQRVKNADRDEFITENVVDRGLRGGEARTKYANARFLKQPFKRGETIVIPAGTKFHSWDAQDNDVYGEFKEPREIKINDTFDAYIDGTSDWVQLHPAQVSYAGPHGRWRDIVLTPEIVAMNGKPVYEDAIGMESVIRPSLHEEISRSN